MEPEVQRDMRISWVPPAKMHLTIKFLGDMDEQFLDPLLGAVEQAIGSQPSVNVPIERLGTFPHPQSPRVLWVGPSEHWERGVEGKRVTEIHRAIEQACEDFGFLHETKPFSPHLTLARMKTGERRQNPVPAFRVEKRAFVRRSRRAGARADLGIDR